MTTTLGIDQFSLNGIPSDVDAMHNAFPFGWYQISSGMEVGIMVRKAWPVYARHYGGYHFFNPNPNGNWIFQSWNDYAEACAWLFLDSMKGDFGRFAPMIDVEARVSLNYLKILFPNLSLSQQIQKGNELYFKMLKIICDLVEQETGQIPVLYTGNSLWIELGGQTQTWAARLPLMVALYPFDNFSNQAEYLAAIKKVMDGTAALPEVKIPPPWTAATYVQFTGRGPASLIPGYAKEANWAKTVDISIQVAKEAIPVKETTPGIKETTPVVKETTPVVVVTSHDPGTNLFRCNRLLNVHEGPSQATEILGNLPKGTVVNIDQVQGSYSHFLQLVQYPQGGWIFSSFLEKIPA
jgi:hypothetical protein